MYLVNVFTPVLQQIKQTVHAIQADKPSDYEVIVGQIRQLIEESRSEFESALEKNQFFYQEYIDHDHYWLSLYAVVTCIDELMIKAPWDGAAKWQNNSFQRTYFSTLMGGKEFFDKLKQLESDSPGDQEVRRVYFYCLCLGFQGEYYLHEDQLDRMMQENYQLLYQGNNSATFSDQQKKVGAKQNQPYSFDKKKKLLCRLLWIAPLIVLPAIYFIFRFQILAVSQKISAIF